jgi:hypothetical protein
MSIVPWQARHLEANLDEATNTPSSAGSPLGGLLRGR